MQTDFLSRSNMQASQVALLQVAEQHHAPLPYLLDLYSTKLREAAAALEIDDNSRQHTYEKVE